MASTSAVVPADLSRFPSYTIVEFCRRWQISTPTYYELKKMGLGPREVRIKSAVRISAEAEAEWRQRMEQPSGETAEIIAAGEERLRERSRRATSASRRTAA